MPVGAGSSRSSSLGLTLIGRSSSHFTRVARIFAAELEVPYEYQIARDLMSVDPEQYGGNPALKLPVLMTPQGICLGALNICRELKRQSSSPLRIVWPESTHELLMLNAQELITHAMSTGVNLVMSRLARGENIDAHQDKMVHSLTNTMSWLNDHVQAALNALPSERDLSYLEVSLFCLATHMEFRQVMSMSAFGELTRFAESFARRASAQATPFRFDA